MSNMNRRTFLKASTGAIGVSAVRAPLFAKTRIDTQNNKNAKIYTVFYPTAPSQDDTSVVPTTNEEILTMLKKECDGVDFIARDLSSSAAGLKSPREGIELKPSTLESVINEMESLKKLNFDGVLIIGQARNYALTETSGLPTIITNVIGDFMGNPYALYRKQGKILKADIDTWRFSVSPDDTAAMFKDLVEKIKLIKAFKKMKESRILIVTDAEYVNSYRGDARKTYPPGYNEIILNALDEVFGTKVVKIGTDEITDDEEIKNLWYNDSKEAEEIAKMWIRDAKVMENTIESEVVRSAKVYLALKILMKKYNADTIAFHIRTLIKNPKPEDMVWPCLCTSEFQKQGIVACCQGHLNILLTHMLAQYAFGRPSMMGDFQVDTFHNVSIVQHCEGPMNIHGGKEIVPYKLCDHRERRVREHSKTGVGAAATIYYPPNEPVTIWRINLLTKEILVHTGKTVLRPSVYRDHFEEMM
ncbi:hypothetical protein ACFL4Z_02660 [candidate division KSB1 bacterium]